jgi:hypothetical protein
VPSASPLSRPSRNISIFAPSSERPRYSIIGSSGLLLSVPATLTSSVAWPFSEIVALSSNQHRSPPYWPALLGSGFSFVSRSSAQARNSRSRYPGHMSQPSPAQEPWVLVPDVRPSIDPELYDSPRSGFRPPLPPGSRNGYDQEKSPVWWLTCQLDAGLSEVAV